MEKKVVVIGGGAAGFFGAIHAALTDPSAEVVIIEKTRQLLSKVKISGGGRCNVTHSCFDPNLLVKHYPRGEKALKGPFHQFQPLQTIEWFSARGVALKTEEDGRIFPSSDRSQTIIDCLMAEAARLSIRIETETACESIEKKESGFLVHLAHREPLACDALLLATGSNHRGWEWAAALGHTIVPPLPSLFTFNVPDSPLSDLTGLSVPKAKVKLPQIGLEESGPLLITHWGFSGPAVLKLSAWGARLLHALDYHTELQINWLPEQRVEELREALISWKREYPSKLICSDFPLPLPKNLWKRLCTLCTVAEDKRWSQLSNQDLHKLLEMVSRQKLTISGKTTYKQEFVTCGGISLAEVNFKTMESRLCKGLFFAGEVLDIDGVTGGFNFQNAWTTGWLAGNAIANA